MYKHILIATDGSELAGRAVAAGLELAKTLGAKVTAVTATEPWSVMAGGEPALAFPIEDYDKAAAENAARVLYSVSETAAQAGVACETLHINDFPAEGIVETAKARGCDLIRDGLARPPGPVEADPGKPGVPGACPQHGSGAGLPVVAAAIGLCAARIACAGRVGARRGHDLGP